MCFLQSQGVMCFSYHENMNYAAASALLCCIPKTVNSSRTQNNNKHVSKVSASHQWKKKMDLTTDDDHGILRLNNTCRVQSVTKTQGKKKSRQSESG